MGIGVSSHDEVRRARCVAGGAGGSAMSAGMPSPAFHVRVDDFARGLFSVRGAALDGTDGLHWSVRGRTNAPHDLPANRGSMTAQPVAGGAGGRRAGVSAAHKIASTSAISAATSGSRYRISDSGLSMVSLVASAAVTMCLIVAHPSRARPAGQALMAWPLLLPMAILRGLACSATGIFSRSTPAVVAGLDVLGVEVVAEDQLPAEHPARALGGDQLRVAGAGRALGLDGDTLRSTSRSIESGVDARAGRTRRWNVSPSRQASIGITAGRAACRRCRRPAG